MNERIRELAIQAGFEFWQDEPWNIDWSSRYDASYDDEFIKFAELIVKECVTVLNNRFMGDMNREDLEVRRCIADVKQHFGVAE